MSKPVDYLNRKKIRVFVYTAIIVGAILIGGFLYSYQVEAQAQGACTLTGAYWTQNFCGPPIIGSPMHMVVDGVNCPGVIVNLEVYDMNILPGLTYHVGSNQAIFDSYGYKAETIWFAYGVEIDPPYTNPTTKWPSQNFRFRFYASAGSPVSKVTSNDLLIPINSEKGCINCWNIIFKNATCDCADGFQPNQNSPINFGQRCYDLCVGHTGDSLTDVCGGGGGGGTQPPVQGGRTVNIPWKITNPLITLPGGAQPQNVVDVIILITDWILDIATVLIVGVVIYGGIMFLISAGNPGKIQQAKNILFWALVGFLIVLIGKGFVFLIESVLNGQIPIIGT